MTPKRAASLAAVAALAAALYLLPIDQRGLVGPDEPRYGSIARQMAESGDWITPRLNGEAWFEKPSMLFWLGGLGYLAGLESFTRVPVALLSLGFLLFLYWRVREEFDGPTAAAAACILATSAGWVASSDAGVFDLPLAAYASAALLCLLPWVADPDSDRARRWMPWFGGCLGLSVLSKGLVGPIVAAFAVLPVLAARPRRLLDLFSPRALAPFLAVSLPWYVACYVRNGSLFVEEFLVRHHWDRFFNESLQHQQPVWFFVPVLLAFALPWTPLLCGLRRESLWSEPRLRFLTAWAILPVVFFSLSVNKLPLYILPVLPAVSILLALQWRRRPSKAFLLGTCCSLLLLPLAGDLLPGALADGITRAWAEVTLEALTANIGAGAAVAGLAGWVALKSTKEHAVPAVAAVATLALALLKFQAYPAVSQAAGVREFVAANQARLAEACVGDVRRHVAYGLSYYASGLSLPSCEAQPQKYRIEGDPPQLISTPPEPSTVARPPLAIPYTILSGGPSDGRFRDSGDVSNP